MNRNLTLSSHFDELRSALLKSIFCIILGILVSWIYSKEIFSFLTHDIPLIVTSPLEGFFVSIKLSFYAGLLLTSPLWLYFLLQFFLPAFTSKERRWIAPLMLSLFVFGSLALMLSLKAVIPLANTFFADYNTAYAQNLWTLSSYISFVVTLSLSLLIGSQLVGILFLLVHFGVFSHGQLTKHRRGGLLRCIHIGCIADTARCTITADHGFRIDRVL